MSVIALVLLIHNGAYFRHGKVFALDFQDIVLASDAKSKIDALNVPPAVKQVLTDSFDALVKAYRKELCTKDTEDGQPCRILNHTSDETFVTRAGAEYGFQKITGAIDLASDKKLTFTKIDWKAIPPDLVRVALEALGDEAARVPGAANSTMCKERPQWCKVEGETSESLAKKLALVDRAGNVTEAGTASLFGSAIRGGWLASLNNEVLADTLTAAAAVTLRKGAEAATWKAIDQCPAGPRREVAANFQEVRFKFVN